MISVLIISKNDEDVIGDAIKSVKELASEIIVVDDSTDKTPEIAEKLGARVFKNTFRDFSDQRNLAATLAHNQWIFYLDCDERATSDFIKEVKEKVSIPVNSPDISGFIVRRKTFFLGKDWNFEDKVERIFLKSKLKGWHGIVHETPEVEGRLLEIKSPILHFTHRDLTRMVDKTNEWSDYEASLRIKANHPKMSMWRFPRVMITGFLKSYFKEGGYKNGTAGLVESIYQSFSMFITYAKLWEKQQEKK